MRWNFNRSTKTKTNCTLKIIGKHPNGLCEHCNVEETIPRVFLECRKYEKKEEKWNSG